ncbi:MAG: aspartyl protease family protein [Methanomassiliicoccales archaeon]|nr:aspartyl protease family protein [Methanomassiliicoccales archaeon]
MVLNFKYKEIKNPDGQKRKRPMVPITLSNGDESFEILALLDSGADVTAIPLEMAEALDLDLTGQIGRSIGIGGPVDSMSSRVNVSI